MKRFIRASFVLGAVCWLCVIGAAANSAFAQDAVFVKRIHVTGNGAISSAELETLWEHSIGRELSLVQLEQIADAITRHYAERGYMLAQAYVPPQVLEDGVVEIVVMEGRYDEIILDNASRLKDSVALRLLRPLSPGDFIHGPTHERALLLLTDRTGVRVGSVFSPGGQTGTADLTVQLADERRMSGSVEVDSYGNRLMGATRVGLALNTPLTGYGDAVTVRMVSSGAGFTAGNVLYSLPVGGANLLEAAYHTSAHELGAEFAVLEMGGWSRNVSLSLSHALRRSRQADLNVVAGFERKSSGDHILTIATEKHVNLYYVDLNGGSVGAGGDRVRYALRLGGGELRLDAASLPGDQATARTHGTFVKLTAEGSRAWILSDTTQLHGSMRAQWTSKNLDGSEKFALGGPAGVRAYASGASGDQGWLTRWELHRRLDVPWLPAGAWRVMGFVDGGGVQHNKQPWTAAPNFAHNYGVGVGLIGSVAGRFTLHAEHAWPIASAADAPADDRSGQLWVRMGFQF